MIDTHCHLIPFIDDGAADWDTALAMARAAAADGIRQAITTPHWTGEPGEAATILQRVGELQERLDAENIRLKIHAGNEVVLVPRLVEALRSGEALTQAGSSYILLETAQFEHGAYVHEALFQLQSHGYRVILAHPERLNTWQKSLTGLADLVRRGCHLQVNAGSLLGGFGAPAKRAAEEIVRRRWASLLATDAHSLSTRPPLLRPAVRRCAQLIGELAAAALVEDHPARVLCNEQLPYVDTENPAPARRFTFPWRPRP